MREYFIPERALIKVVKQETGDTATYTLAFENEEACHRFSFRPGQFNMLTVFGIGEAPISISSNPENPVTFQHTVRRVGNVTNALASLEPGSVVGVRGPYGTGWPLMDMAGRKVVAIAGGIGLAPLRPLILTVLGNRHNFKGLEILYGARTPADMLYTGEYPEWRDSGFSRLHLTVDMVPEGTGWDGHVGVVTKLLDHLGSGPEDSVVAVCGPEVMMKYVARGLVDRGFAPEQIYVSLERRMSCGVRKCGNCQIGPVFVCRDGPVFAYAELLALPEEIL